MRLSKELIEHLANLARLELTEEEKKRYLKDFSSILGYVEQIKKLGASKKMELLGTKDFSVWREDLAVACSKDERKIIIESFPEKEADLLKVKGVFE